MYWQTDDADRLAALCGCLPRPLVAVGNHLRNTTSSAGWFVDALSDGRMGLSALAANGTTLRDSLAASYRRLPDAVRSVFRRLGCFPGETITSSAVEAVADKDVDAHGAIDAMVAEGLLVEQWLGGGCADFPAPFRMMARDLLADEDRSAPARVLDQALTFYADKAESALAVWLGDHPSGLDPEMSEMVRRTSRGFLMGESDNLLRLLENAATHNLDAAVRMAVPLLEYLTRNDPKADLEAVHESVRYAIKELPEDHRDTFDLFLTMNAVYTRLSRPAEAADCLLTAQKAAEDAGDGQLAEQAARLLLVAFEDKLTAARGAEDRDGIANGLMLVASAHRDLGDPAPARQLLMEALTHTHATGNVPYTAEILADLGDVSRTIGQLAESAQCLQESVRLFEQTEDREGLALALESLSDTFTELGMHPEAAAALERSDSLLPDDD
jgi:hypothetical protein